MSIIAWMMSLIILMTLMIQAVNFHKATVCRQKAWLKSTELLTSSTLSKAPKGQTSWLPGCRIHVKKENHSIYWMRYPELKKHHFKFELRGSL